MSQKTNQHTLAYNSILNLEYLLTKIKASKKISFKVKTRKIHREKIAVITENEVNQTSLISHLLQKPERCGQPRAATSTQSYWQLFLFSRLAKMKESSSQTLLLPPFWLRIPPAPQTN